MTPPAPGGPDGVAEARNWAANPVAPQASATFAGHGRLHFMDNLRVALTVLIVFQHASFAYAPASWWYFVDTQQQPLLAAFFVVNRSFRMSLFFLIAGYFMPYVLDRKGARLYLKDRFRRFGIPLLAFLFVVIPPLMYAYYLNFRPYGPIGFFDYYIHVYWGIGRYEPQGWSGPNWPDHQFGHLWFIEMLLVYALLYTGWRWLRHRFQISWPGPLRFPALPVWLLAIAAVAAWTFKIRLTHPVYDWDAYLGVIQLSLADFPRDLACLLLGILAFRNDWLRRLPSSTGYAWLAVGVAGAAIFVICDLSGHSFFSTGGTSLDGVIYPIWETVTCLGFCLGLPILFRELFDFRNRVTDRLSAASYGVYVIHLPIVVLLQYALAAAALGAVAKFLIVGLVALPLAYFLVVLLRLSPRLRQVV
jgi:peptidoglycan/LPS O-acetylase OafA/YrhL